MSEGKGPLHFQHGPEDENCDIHERASAYIKDYFHVSADAPTSLPSLVCFRHDILGVGRRELSPALGSKHGCRLLIRLYHWLRCVKYAA